MLPCNLPNASFGRVPESPIASRFQGTHSPWDSSLWLVRREAYRIMQKNYFEEGSHYELGLGR